MPIPSLPNVSSPYGAPMGRNEYGEHPEGKVRLYRLRLDRDGYDRGGAYWGIGMPLWRAEDSEGNWARHVRAPDRKLAAKVLGVENVLARK